MNPRPVTEKSEGKTDKGTANGLVAFVGAGPGDDGLLTVRAAELLAHADLVVAGPELADRMERLVPAQTPVTEADALAQDPKLLVKAARAGQLVVRLLPGDPLLFGHAAAEASVCAKAVVVFEIVPGIPTATAVLLRIRKWTRRSGGDLALAAPQPTVRRVLEASGLIDVFSVYRSVDQAASGARHVPPPAPPAPPPPVQVSMVSRPEHRRPVYRMPCHSPARPLYRSGTCRSRRTPRDTCGKRRSPGGRTAA